MSIRFVRPASEHKLDCPVRDREQHLLATCECRLTPGEDACIGVQEYTCGAGSGGDGCDGGGVCDGSCSTWNDNHCEGCVTSAKLYGAFRALEAEFAKEHEALGILNSEWEKENGRARKAEAREAMLLGVRAVLLKQFDDSCDDNAWWYERAVNDAFDAALSKEAK